MTNLPNINQQAEVEIRKGQLLLKAKRNEQALKRTITKEKYLQGKKEYAEYLEELRLVRLRMEESEMIAVQNEFVWRAKAIEAIGKAISDAKVHTSDISGISFNLSFPEHSDVKRYYSQELFTAPTRFAVLGYDVHQFAKAKKLDAKSTNTIEQLQQNFNEAYGHFVDSAFQSEATGSVYIAGNEEYGHVWIEFAYTSAFLETAQKYGYHEFKPKEN
ncbi:MAG: hypothetical protein NC548_06295 [Lachnospiraceae bacterium]|nr:hypothetical protein [Lachnospiraceae bacterium]